jgi:transposase-like protein
MLLAEITDLAVWATLAFLALCYFGEKLFAAGRLKQILNHLGENQKRQTRWQIRANKSIRYLAKVSGVHDERLEEHDREINRLKNKNES